METSPGRNLTDLRRRARAEASAWIVRLHGTERDAELEAGFRAWLTASPENARQFEKVTEVWDAGATLVPGIARIGRWENAPTRRAWPLAASIGALLIGLGIWAATVLWLNPSYGTAVGEQRLVRLSDGSRVTLNSNSRVAISYRRDVRHVTVDRGEAFFEVAKDASRPFRVRAGDHQVNVLGTSFIVRRSARHLTVTLVEGKVSVSQLNEPPVREESRKRKRVAVVTLEPGQRLQMSAADIEPKIDTPRIEAVTAWRHGEVMLDNTVLADAVAEMNRYDHRALVIDDPQIAGLRVSGIYHTGDNELFGAMVASLHGLKVEQRDGRIHLRSGRTIPTVGE